MRIGIVANQTKPRAREAAQELCEWLSERGVDCHIPALGAGEADRDLSPQDTTELLEVARQTDLVVAFGGDGTVLSVAGAVAPAGKAVFPVNVGGMGFLTEVDIEGLYPAMEEILAEKFTVEPRMMLEMELGGRTELALNEVVIHRGGTPQPAHILIRRRGKSPISFAGDGLIIATPTGSTAYSLSAGGPILDPAVSAILCTPICPQASFVRSFILPAEEELTVKAKIMTGGDVGVFVDGQTSLPFSWEEELTVKRAEVDFSLVRVKGWEIFQILRERMDWRDMREDKV